MKVDIGFWNEKGEYIEQIEELTMEEEKEIMGEKLKLKANKCFCLNCGAELASYSVLKEQLKLLQAENERLKKEIKKEKEIYKENVHYLACMTSQRNKLKLALEEIREINKKWLSRWLNDPDERYGFEEIETKINEVLKGGE